MTRAAMTVHVRLFAAAREVAGDGELALDLPEESTIADVRQALIEALPGLTDMLSHAMFAVNQQYADYDRGIVISDDIACIPPVSGG